LIIGKGDPLIGRLLLLTRGYEIPRGQAAEGSRLPGVQEKPNHYKVIDYEQFWRHRLARKKRRLTNGLKKSPHRLRNDGPPRQVRLTDVREPHDSKSVESGLELIPWRTRARANDWTPRTYRGALQIRRAKRARHPDPSTYGFQKTAESQSGILAWSDDVDPRFRNLNNGR